MTNSFCTDSNKQPTSPNNHKMKRLYDIIICQDRGNRSNEKRHTWQMRQLKEHTGFLVSRSRKKKRLILGWVIVIKLSTSTSGGVEGMSDLYWLKKHPCLIIAFMCWSPKNLFRRYRRQDIDRAYSFFFIINSLTKQWRSKFIIWIPSLTAGRMKSRLSLIL